MSEKKQQKSNKSKNETVATTTTTTTTTTTNSNDWSKLNYLLKQDSPAHPAIFNTTLSLLKADPNDKDVLKIKIISMIQQGQYESVLDILKQLSDHQQNELIYEHCYCLYRQNRLRECSQLLSQFKTSLSSSSHLQAQTHYRHGDFNKAATIYEKMLNQELDEEVLTNLLAAYVSGEQYHQAFALAKKYEKLNSFEVSYNVACAMLETDDLQTAYTRLDQAAKICEATLTSEGASAEEINDEIAVVRVQQAYILQLLHPNQPHLASDIYTAVLKDQPSDATVVAAASNNLISLRKKDEKIFDSVKRAERALKVPPHKLSIRQRNAIHFNRCLLFLHNKKVDKCRELLESLEKEDYMQTPQDREFMALIHAAIAHREGQQQQAIDVLQSHIKNYPNNCVHAQLTMAHIHLLVGETKEAAAQLESIQSIKHKPALVAVMVALYQRSGDVDGVIRVLDQAVNATEKLLQSNSDKQALSNLTTLLEQSAQFKISNGRTAQALETFERLLNVANSKLDAATQARYAAHLVISAAQHQTVEHATLAKYAARLPSISSLFPQSQSVDVNALESIQAPLSRAAEKTEAGAGEEIVKKKKSNDKKKKKKRYPKGFDPNNPTATPLPDPERWLPKWERSAFKKLRARRRQVVKGGAQGSMTEADMEEFDETKQDKKSSSPKKLPAHASAASSSAGRRRKGKK